jgi:hypothetical protein
MALVMAAEAADVAAQQLTLAQIDDWLQEHQPGHPSAGMIHEVAGARPRVPIPQGSTRRWRALACGPRWQVALTSYSRRPLLTWDLDPDIDLADVVEEALPLNGTYALASLETDHLKETFASVQLALVAGLLGFSIESLVAFRFIEDMRGAGDDEQAAHMIARLPPVLRETAWMQDPGWSERIHGQDTAG